MSRIFLDTWEQDRYNCYPGRDHNLDGRERQCYNK